MRVGIIGSRRRNSENDRNLVFELVRDLKVLFGTTLVVVSGGCRKGADQFTKEACFEYDVSLVEHLPVYDPPPADKYEATRRLYARNTLVAGDVRIMFALPAEDRTGGSEDTITKALARNVPVTLILEDGSNEQAVPKKKKKSRKR